MKAKDKKTFLPVIVFLCVCLFAAQAAAERPPFKIYTTEENLAHDSINRIVRDARGFLWFCTAEGLSRFDGYKFKITRRTRACRTATSTICSKPETAPI